MIDRHLVESGTPAEDRIRQCLSFVIELEGLKRVERAIIPAGLDRFENPAEHSWQAALFGLMIAPVVDPSINPGRVAELLLVHDLGEIDAGDQLAFTPVSSDRANAEAAGARRIGALLPQASGERLLALWNEFTEGETAEARLANAIDRLMPVLQNLANGGQSWRENGISRERVDAKVGPPLRAGAPAFWDILKPALDEAEQEGLFGA